MTGVGALDEGEDEGVFCLVDGGDDGWFCSDLCCSTERERKRLGLLPVFCCFLLIVFFITGDTFETHRKRYRNRQS